MAVTAVRLIRPPRPVDAGRTGQRESEQDFDVRERGVPTVRVQRTGVPEQRRTFSAPHSQLCVVPCISHTIRQLLT